MQVQLLAGEKNVRLLRVQVFSSKKASVDGPCTWPDHSCGSGESCEDNRHPRITRLRKGDPQFDAGDQCSYHRCPETNEKKYPGASANDLRNCRCRNGCLCELNNPEANENDGSQKALEQKADPWPTVGKGGKKSLQESLRPNRKGITARPKRLKDGDGDPTFGGDDPVR